MKCKAGLKGRRTKRDRRSMRYHCDKLHMDAINPGDSYILAAIYHSLFREDDSLTRAIVRKAKRLERAEQEMSPAAKVEGGDDGSIS